MIDYIILCTLCAGQGLWQNGNMPPVAIVQTLTTNLSVLYAVGQSPVWMWHLPQRQMGGNRYPSAYRTPPQEWETPPSSLPAPTGADWIASPVWGEFHPVRP